MRGALAPLFGPFMNQYLFIAAVISPLVDALLLRAVGYIGAMALLVWAAYELLEWRDKRCQSYWESVGNALGLKYQGPFLLKLSGTLPRRSNLRPCRAGKQSICRTARPMSPMIGGDAHPTHPKAAGTPPPLPRLQAGPDIRSPAPESSTLCPRSRRSSCARG